jgi:O-antigen/teichoic acid export membrane protein
LKTSKNSSTKNKNLRQSWLRLRQLCKGILTASMPNWVPSSIMIVGVQAGTIIVFGASGPSQAGVYFMAFSIFSAIGIIASSLLSAAFPALSAMQDGRKRFSWRTIKISLIISLPLSSSAIFYSEDILGLLSPEYVKGSASLDILLLSVLPTAVFTGISTLVYAYGNYRQVLGIGLAVSLPRTILYIVLVPFYGGIGAALSYTLGSVVGLIVSRAIAEKIGFKIFWRELASMLCISLAIAFSLAYLQINYIFGIPLTLAISYILLVRMQILTRRDIQDTVGILPTRVSNPAIKALNIIAKKLNPSY